MMVRFAPLPTPVAALDWLMRVGGAPTAALLARASGHTSVSIVPAETKRGALIAVKQLRAIAASELVGSPGCAPSTLDTADELWHDHSPADWDDATARVQEVVDASDARRAAFAPTYLPSAGFAPPTAPGLPPTSTCHPADLADVVRSLGTAFKALDGSSGRRAGELKPALASTAQKEARTACTAEVLEPITDPKFVEAERALGPISQRGGDFGAELRRTRALPPTQSHAAAAYAVSCGARLEDTSGGVPTNISQLRQAGLAALKDDCEVARGGPNRREIDEAGFKLIHAAAEGALVGAVSFPAFVKLFGGTTPAQSIQTLGSAGAGRDGSVSSRTDIEKALRLWARLTARVHAPLFGLHAGPTGDFGVSDFLTEAEHMLPERLMRACAEAFEVIRRQFIAFRSSLGAAQPDPGGAFTRAIESALKPLYHEQVTVTIATSAAEAAAARANGAGGARGSATQDNKALQALKQELTELKRQSTKRFAAGAPQLPLRDPDSRLPTPDSRLPTPSVAACATG